LFVSSQGVGLRRNKSWWLAPTKKPTRKPTNKPLAPKKKPRTGIFMLVYLWFLFVDAIVSPHEPTQRSRKESGADLIIRYIFIRICLLDWQKYINMLGQVQDLIKPLGSTHLSTWNEPDVIYCRRAVAPWEMSSSQAKIDQCPTISKKLVCFLRIPIFVFLRGSEKSWSSLYTNLYHSSTWIIVVQWSRPCTALQHISTSLSRLLQSNLMSVTRMDHLLDVTNYDKTRCG
jgi:hypothetical protein